MMVTIKTLVTPASVLDVRPHSFLISNMKIRSTLQIMLRLFLICILRLNQTRCVHSQCAAINKLNLLPM